LESSNEGENKRYGNPPYLEKRGWGVWQTAVSNAPGSWVSTNCRSLLKAGDLLLPGLVRFAVAFQLLLRIRRQVLTAIIGEVKHAIRKTC